MIHLHIWLTASIQTAYSAYLKCIYFKLIAYQVQLLVVRLNVVNLKIHDSCAAAKCSSKRCKANVNITTGACYCTKTTVTVRYCNTELSCVELQTMLSRAVGTNKATYIAVWHIVLINTIMVQPPHNTKSCCTIYMMQSVHHAAPDLTHYVHNT